MPTQDISKLPPVESFEELRKRELQFYLFGLHISGSKSPLLQNSIFKKLGMNWNYKLHETNDPEEFKRLLHKDNCIGSAVTMPNKIAFVSEIDECDEVGKGVGSINTVYKRRRSDGTIINIGTNTDTIGIRESFLQNPKARPLVEESKAAGLPGLVYGGGGASYSAVYALHTFFDCKEVYVVNRDKGEVEALEKMFSKNLPQLKITYVSSPELAEGLKKPLLFVSTVPNFPPTTPAELNARGTLEVFIQATRGAVLEMCYHPSPRTILYDDFEKAGWIVIGGADAMIYQGFAQIMLWSGLTLDQIPVEYAKKVIYDDIEAAMAK